MSLSQARLTQNERSSEDHGSAGWLHWVTLFLITAAGLIFRIRHLGSKPFWFDECFSVVLARLNWSNFLHALWWREANMTLYYLLLRVWMHLGNSESLARSLSVVIAAATIPAVYWLANLLYDRRTALLASALFAVNAYSIRYSQEARSYALFVLLATLSSGFLVASLREPNRRNRRAYILTSIFAVYAHLYALLLVVARWLAIRLFGGPNPGDAQNEDTLPQIRRGWKIIGLAVLPLLIFVAKTGAGPIRWIQRPGARDLLVFAEQLTGAGGWPLLALYLIACIAASATARKKLFRRNESWETWRVQFLLLWLIFPIVLTVLLSFARPVFLGRYMIFCLPALVTLAAAGINGLRPAWLAAPGLAAFFVLSLPGVWFVYDHDFDDQRDGSSAATDFILNHAEPGDGIIFDIAEARVPYEFFRSLRAGQGTARPNFKGQIGPEILFPHTGSALQFQDFKSRLTEDSLRSLVPGHQRVWVFLIYNGTQSAPDVTTRLLTRSLPDRFPHEQRWQFPRIEVRLYKQ